MGEFPYAIHESLRILIHKQGAENTVLVCPFRICYRPPSLTELGNADWANSLSQGPRPKAKLGCSRLMVFLRRGIIYSLLRATAFYQRVRIYL